MDSELHPTAARQLRTIRQRYTAQRQALVSLLAASAQPLTIPQILARDAALPQSSLYRNLTVLEQAGVVRRIVTSDEFARYELSETLTEHHHHLVCAACGGVEDFTVPVELEEQLQAMAARATKQRGYLLSGHHFDLLGTCPRCAAR